MVGVGEVICEAVSNSPDKWASIIEADAQEIPEAASRFVQLNQEIAAQWEVARKQEIITASLDSAKVATFRESFLNRYNTAPSIRSLLERSGRVSYNARARGMRDLGFMSGLLGLDVMIILLNVRRV